METKSTTIDPEVLSTAESILEHHGVKGMKWGVRRSNRKTQKVIKARSHGNIKNLSNEELTVVLQRMELDKKYRDLKKAGRSEGKDYVIELSKKATTAAVTTSVSFGVKKALGSKWGTEDKPKKETSKDKTSETKTDKVETQPLNDPWTPARESGRESRKPPKKHEKYLESRKPPSP